MISQSATDSHSRSEAPADLTGREFAVRVAAATGAGMMVMFIWLLGISDAPTRMILTALAISLIGMIAAERPLMKARRQSADECKDCQVCGACGRKVR